MSIPGLVSVIVVNYRTERYLKACLASIRSQDFPRIELILVNNGSEDFRKLDLSGFAIDKLIENSKNLGFAKANNQAILASRGEFILLLNADATIPSSFVSKAVRILSENPHIFCLVPQVRMWLKPGFVESSGHILRRDFTAAHRDFQSPLESAQIKPGDVFGGTAACIFYRREGLEMLRVDDEFFDEDFFSYFEDVDLDIRANLLGLKYFYEPSLVAYHVGAGSGARRDLALRILAEKNRYLSLVKCLRFSDILPNLLELLLYEVYHLLQVIRAPYLLLGIYQFFKHLPSCLRKRKEIQKKRVLSSSALQKLLFSRFVHPRSLPPPSFTPKETKAKPSSLQPAASIIVVNFNGKDDTSACLASLRQQSSGNFEIILIDNGSKLFEAEDLAKEFPEAKVVLVPYNLGFAGGANVGFRFANGKYIILLNNDTIAEPSFLENLLRAMDETGADAGCGVLIEQDSIPTNDSLNFLLYNIKDVFGKEAICFYPSGGAAIIRMQSLQKLGQEIFDDDYFLYYEDVHLGFRIRLAGGKVIKISDACVRHKGQSTVKKLPFWLIQFYRLRNRILSILTFYEGVTIARLFAFLLADFLYWHLRAFISLNTLKAVLLTDWSILVLFPSLIRRRYFFGRLRKELPLSQSKSKPTRDHEILKWFSHKLLNGESFLNDFSKLFLHLLGLKTAD